MVYATFEDHELIYINMVPPEVAILASRNARAVCQVTASISDVWRCLGMEEGGKHKTGEINLRRTISGHP